MYFTMDPEGQILSANAFLVNHLGYDEQELCAKRVLEITPEENWSEMVQTLNSLMRVPEKIHQADNRRRKKDGSVIWVRDTYRVTRNGKSPPVILVVSEEVTETRLLFEKLSYQENHDSLTGLINRREFERRLRRMLDSAMAENLEHAMCFLDLDQFKVINDTCGHVAGDELLRQVSRFLNRKMNPSSTLARLGGDEFGILIENCSLRQAKRIANGLKKSLRKFKFVWDDKSFNVRVSIGLVPVNASSHNTASLLSKADEACFVAKDKGRNRIQIYDETDTELARRQGEMQSVARINKALEGNRFRLFFQTIAAVANGGQGDHYELLIRMEEDDGRMILPAAFLPAAERYNLSDKLDRWVVCNAIEWLKCHPQELNKLKICSINLSAQSLGDPDLLKFIIKQLEEAPIPQEKICFEVTETAAIANLANAIEFFKVLKRKGCLFALDDFGSGFSSFAYLKRLPVDFIKIDGMFVKDIVDDPIDFAMVKSINEIGKVMGKRTIAEFVESAEILAKLKKIGVDYAQGYGISRPRPLI